MPVLLTEINALGEQVRPDRRRVIQRHLLESKTCQSGPKTSFVHSYSIHSCGFHVVRCIDAAQGFVKLRLLEVILPCGLDFYCPDLGPVWESRMEEHAITALGNICGHTKSFKMISISDSPRQEIIHNAETQIIAVP